MGCACSLQSGNTPATVLKGSLQNAYGVDAPVGDSPEPDHEPRGCRAGRNGISPDLSQVCGELFRAAVDQLALTSVVHRARAPQEPVAQPLIRYVGAHPIVRRRCDHPVKRLSLSGWLKSRGLAAVS